MYGGSAKLGGRGRGGGPVKRNIHSAFQPSSVQRPSTTPAGAGHRNRSTTPAAAAATTSTAEESFSLVRNNPLNFGMIIRLTPVLIEEIKRLEAEGGVARMRFDSSANNPNGNVINVGDKEFRFTWSQETGDLCDIYEERRTGDGDGLLVESGGAWRKLNVQRELDESVKNHVKMRTVEAERKHKSRKAIILDHKNPSMKNQMKALAAAEVNNAWRGSYKQKKDLPFKKTKPETSSAVIPIKSGGKAGFSSSTPSKVRASTSPLQMTPEQSGVPLSPLRSNNVNKLHANREDATLTQSSKENTSTSEREMFNRVPVPAGIVQNKPGSNERFGNKPTDLQSLLISLLMGKPQGMNLKALEKAIGETIPKSVKQIEPILKKIAVFQAPGRYILKPDVELESVKNPLFESGSSPENNNHHREATTAPESSFPSRTDDVTETEQASHLISKPYEDLNILENNDIGNPSPEALSDKKVSHNNEDHAVSSSRSGSESDSESDSSDSESNSRSPVGSKSGNSSDSDSDSDASLNSKQGSDEDVDIMSDDDKEPNQNEQPFNHELGYAQHNMLDLEKDLFEDNKDEENYADDTKNLFNNHLHHQESEVHGHAKKVVSRSNTSKRGSDEKHFDESENAKRLKSGNRSRSSVSRSPDGPRMMGRTVGDLSDYDYENVNNREFLGNSTLDSPRSGPRSIDLNARAKPPADMDNIVRFSERDPQDNRVNKETRDEDGQPKDRRPPKNSGGKPPGSHLKKHGALIGKNKEPELLSTSQIKNSPADLKKSTVINGRGPALQRELSDLEMGELRENWHEEKRFGRNNSFKQSENKSSSDYWNLDESTVKPNDVVNLPKKVVSDDHVDDFTRSNGKQSLSRTDHLKSGSQNDKGKHNEAGSEGYTVNTESQRKGHVGGPHKHEKQVMPTKDKKRHKSKDIGEKKKDFRLINSRDNSETKRREMESCSDDSITSYIKYEKDEPEMKGPIRDISQYNEYVQEYHEKYDCYNTLNKILESYRNEFQTFGRDLELAKGRDIERYNKILEQLMESYRQCGMKHKRLKKIFVVLHHELQHLKEMIRDFVEKQTKG
ncbi:putative occludin domain-containing protein [Helianthus anomalus]